mmetsp:Transcript_6115/g.9750  ORF Transcript_6115/g.9750 Transcript_6115/m.9750 type:complete len:95 (+) Transcript_6115:11-295(+)
MVLVVGGGNGGRTGECAQWGVSCVAEAERIEWPHLDEDATKMKRSGLKVPNVFSRVRKTPEHLRCTSTKDMPAHSTSGMCLAPLALGSLVVDVL